MTNASASGPSRQTIRVAQLEAVRRTGRVSGALEALLRESRSAALPLARVLDAVRETSFDLDSLHRFARLSIAHGFVAELKLAVARQTDPTHFSRVKVPYRHLSSPSDDKVEASVRDLFDLRYAHVPDAADPSAFARSVAHLAPRVDLNPEVAAFLHGRRRDRSRPFEAWCDDVRSAAAADLLFGDLEAVGTPLQAMLHHETERLVAWWLPPSQPVIVLTGHVGFTGPRNRLTRSLLKHMLVFRRQSSDPRYAWALGDNRTALFSATRALRDGNPVYIAPDGLTGESRASITVLGRPAQVATGASFLAHDVKAKVLWLHLVKDGDYFAPVFVEGPCAAPGESYRAFSERFWRFYEAILTDYFAGDAINIILREPWHSNFIV